MPRRLSLPIITEKISLLIDPLRRTTPAIASPMKTEASIAFSALNPWKQMFKMINALITKEANYI